jgi:hypothetical protein
MKVGEIYLASMAALTAGICDYNTSLVCSASVLPLGIA